ncbi:serine hydrolase domain-containing protein [Kineococcus glutinatus]|uniref:Serine hydrolase domain-containing protein n=1 Tax=Kineococcus glutinatus TaxID=1070872 RepID=A0ABP9I5L5_9ACTN
MSAGTDDATRVGGWVAPGYEGVRDVFAAHLADGRETGAAFAACVAGRPVVDLHGGTADSAGGVPWREDTAVVVFSGTKGVMSLCLLLLAERGLLDHDRPVAHYWPEFAAHGKGGTTVREALSHRARVPAFREAVTVADLADPVRLAGLLAAQEPFDLAQPHYHALTHGWLTGELLRRVDGRDAGTFVAEELTGPLGLDLWIGLPAELEPRVAVLELQGEKPPPPVWPGDPVRTEVDRLLDTNPPLLGEPTLFNTREVHAAQIPGAGGIATARSMARLYAVLACDGELEGRRWLGEAALREACTEAVAWTTPDGWPNRYSAGFQMQTSRAPFGPAAEGVGHGGFGGSQHGFWPGTGVSFSYCPNRLVVEGEDTRSQALLTALHGAWQAQRAAV